MIFHSCVNVYQRVPPDEIQKSLAFCWLQWQDLHGECGDVELRHQDIGHQLAFGFNG